MSDAVRGIAATRHGQVHYREQGSGPAVLLLPGAGQSSRIFLPLLPHLAPHHRVIAVDTLGSGLSDPLPVPVTFEQLAESMIDLMDALGLKQAAVHGIHTGNKIGAAMAAAWPQRIFAFSYAGQSHSIMAANEPRNAGMRAITRAYFAEPDPKLRRLTAWAKAQQDVGAMWWDKQVFTAPDEAMPRIVGDVVDRLAAIASTVPLYEANFAYDMERDLKRIACPVLIVEIATKHEDEEVGRQIPHLRTVFRHSEAVTFEEPDGVGHTLGNRAVELASVLIPFLARAGQAT